LSGGATKRLSTFDIIFELLKDGRWHTLKEVNKEVRLQEDKLEEIVKFLKEYEFVQLDRKRRRAKLTPSVLAFLTKNQ
jgi:DNA-binding IclR family transcriptional regulator